MAEFSQALQTNAEAGKRETASKEVRQYDFAHPDKLSKAHLRIVQLILSGLERSWSVTLAAILKTEATVTVDSLEQTSFGAYAESLPAPGLFAGLSLGRLPGTGLIALPADLALGIVERWTGGEGKVEGEPRELTHIERRITKRLLDRLATDFGAAWSPAFDLATAVSGFYGSADEIEMNPEEMVLVSGFVWRLASAEHKVSLAIPASSLDPVRDLLTPQRWLRGKASGGNIPAASASQLLEPVMLQSVVELGRTRVSVQDIIGMGIGDVIRLDRTVADSLDVKIGGKVKFYARPGLVGRRLAVQIVEQAQETEQSPAEPENSTEEAPSGG